MGMETDIVQDLESGLAEVIDSLKTNMSKLRTGRANIALLDGIKVDYYGTPTAIAQCANLQVADARMITVKAWDKALIPEIEKAIHEMASVDRLGTKTGRR